jgi:hypothetical protein
VTVDAEYARSKLGLWVRARTNRDTVLLEAQERISVAGGIAKGIGADGEVRWEAAIPNEHSPGSWYEVGRVEFGKPWEALHVPMLEWPRLVHGVQRHMAALITAGWGDTVRDVVEWFEDPLAENTCIMPGVYRIEGEFHPLIGFAGLLLRVDKIDDADDNEERVGSGQFLGAALPYIEAPVTEWVLALLMAAVPVAE